MHPVRKPNWQQATALVSLSTCGAMTGFSLAHATVADMTSPTSLPVHVLDFSQPVRPAASGDGALRSAIVKVANYYLRMAQDKTPAEMEAIIWQSDSMDGVDHGESCAAFASLTLEMGARSVGQQSWVTGGTTYPWPLHDWADVRVDPNPDSPDVVSMLQEAQAVGRWHPLGDGYRPQPGDWVMFDGHVEVVTRYAGGVLYTIGGDSLPNFSVNAHSYRAPLGAQGVTGFIDNGDLPAAGPGGSPGSGGTGGSGGSGGSDGSDGDVARLDANLGLAAIPGMQAPPAAPNPVPDQLMAPHQADLRQVRAQGGQPAGPAVATGGSGTAAIPGAQPITAEAAIGLAPQAAPGYHRNAVPAAASAVPHVGTQQAFINQVAPGAMAAQRRYGIPAAVTIAQAIDESGWGQSELAIKDHNLFGIKGTGPAGSDVLPTQEYINGRWVTTTAAFRVYHNIAESIADHSQLLATDEAYQRAMADRDVPDAFANDLTGVYATDPDYGASLIALMRLYDLYRYDTPSPTAAPQAAAHEVAPVAAPLAAAHEVAPVAVPQPLAPEAPAQAGGAQAGGARAAAQGAAQGATERGEPSIPGVAYAYTAAAIAAPAAGSVRRAAAAGPARRRNSPGPARIATRRYVPQMPATVTTAFITTAKEPLAHAEPLYRDVATRTGIRWELLAACDWMQCQAAPRLSPVHGERLGTRNPDGTMYRSKSDALTQCARELIELSWAVYQIDLTARRLLSVRGLASVFAAFRWGGLLRAAEISAMEFPYSVAGLTVQHMKMRWPDIDRRDAPDKPGTRFRMPFGAVPIVLSLDYPAIARLLREKVQRMVRFLILLLGMLTTSKAHARGASSFRAGNSPGRTDDPGDAADESWYWADDSRDPADEHGTWAGESSRYPRVAVRPDPGPARAGGTGSAGPTARTQRRRIRLSFKWAAAIVLLGLVFRKAIAFVAVTALSGALHLVGIHIRLPDIRFSWPWQSITAGTATNTDVGPWVLQKIEGISRPALGTENFSFVFSHKVSKNIGFWPCWYSSTFDAVGRASATVDLNPGPSWWTPTSGHYLLQVLSRPLNGTAGTVAVTVVLPAPQLPQTVHDVTIDDTLSHPIDTQHSWTYPGFGCGGLIRPQFSEAVLYSQAQSIAFYQATHDPQVTRPLIAAAEAEATQIIRDDFIQPTVNALDYTLARFALRWSPAA